MQRRFFVTLFLLCAVVLWFNQDKSFAQFADRAVITGVVTDVSGAAVPDAKVTITDQATGVQAVVGSNSAGNYSSPPLILGTYKVTVEKTGFKTYSRDGIALTGGVTYRQDASLQPGAVSETVQVEASAVELVNTENATVQHTVGESYYRDLPAVMGADIRLAESLLQLQPGYVPMQPNGDAIFRGSQFTSRMNGGQTMATENWFDGAAFGYAEGHQQTQESSIPYPSVREMTVVQNTFSAQYGHTSGGFITYATKSGTNKFHGNLYDFYTNNKLDASNYFLGPVLKAGGLGTTLPLGQNNWGFAVGGPIPKLKKTFWFFNLDGMDYHSTVNTGYVNTLPTPLQRQGDFSEFLTGAQLTDSTNQPVVDALNRPIYVGEIFNPASTRRTPGGVIVRDGYGFDTTTGLPIPGQANIIPANDPLWSPLATAVIPNIPALDRDTVRVNGFGGSSDDNNKINVRTWLLRVDHTFNDKFSISNTYYENIRPRIAHCGGPQGCNTVNNGETDSASNDTYIGQGFYQRITNHFDHVQMNWIIRPNLFNHTTVAYDRWMMLGHQLAGGVGWNQKLGLGLPDAPIFNNAGFPQLNFNGPVGYTHYGTPWASGGADINNRYQFLDDIAWTTGKHTIKAGVEYRYMTFPQTGWAVNTGGNFNFNVNETGGYDQAGNSVGGPTGNEFASFILGQVDSANFSVPFKYMPRMHYGSFWGNDDIKLTKNLNITLGLRFDLQGDLHEQYGRFSTFDPSALNPVGVPGATIFNSSKANGKSSWNVGPRIGFAYSLNPRTVIRGGYGMYYAGVQADSWDPYPVDGYQTNPVAPNTVNGLAPAFYFNGNGPCPAVRTQLANQNVPCGWPAGSIVLPPQLNADVANGGNPVGVDPRTYTMPRYQNWSVSFQRQLTNNMGIDIAYVGNHGTRLIDGRSSAGVYDNMNPGSVLSTYGVSALQETFTNGVCDTPGGCGGVAAPYATFSGTLAQALRSWPQYQQINWRFFPFGNSHYNALQIAFDRRMAAGLQLKVSYTYSKLMNNGSETGLGSGGPPVQNPSDMSNLYSVSSDDVPHIFSVGWVYNLPFGKGKPILSNASGFVNHLVGNWQISGMQSYSSGRPLSITTDNSGLGGLLFNTAHFPNKAGSGRSGHFSNPYADSYLNQSGWSDPGAQGFGNAPRMDANVRGFSYYNEDISIYKDTYFAEGKYVRFQADAGNAFNRVFYCPVDQFWLPNNGNGNFGKTGSQCNIPRRVQFGLQLFF
ncbi:MAG TPA: TonB-dependent receptor [Candidatus Binatia bacterium]|nr:TonB-dependent receptor [Candidatus Binatia bacterium]